MSGHRRVEVDGLGIFTVAGAEAFKRDVPGAEIHLLGTGHFAVEGDDAAIAEHIRTFLGGRLPA